jgi:hypothetical protein
MAVYGLHLPILVFELGVLGIANAVFESRAMSFESGLSPESRSLGLVGRVATCSERGKFKRMRKVTIDNSKFPKLVSHHHSPSFSNAHQSRTITMADDDDDVSKLRALDATDVDLVEETQDFPSWDKLTCAHMHHLFNCMANTSRLE